MHSFKQLGFVLLLFLWHFLGVTAMPARPSQYYKPSKARTTVPPPPYLFNNKHTAEELCSMYEYTLSHLHLTHILKSKVHLL